MDEPVARHTVCAVPATRSTKPAIQFIDDQRDVHLRVSPRFVPRTGRKRGPRHSRSVHRRFGKRDLPHSDIIRPRHWRDVVGFDHWAEHCRNERSMQRERRILRAGGQLRQARSGREDDISGRFRGERLLIMSRNLHRAGHLRVPRSVLESILVRLWPDSHH